MCNERRTLGRIPSRTSIYYSTASVKGEYYLSQSVNAVTFPTLITDVNQPFATCTSTIYTEGHLVEGKKCNMTIPHECKCSWSEDRYANMGPAR